MKCKPVTTSVRLSLCTLLLSLNSAAWGESALPSVDGSRTPANQAVSIEKLPSLGFETEEPSLSERWNDSAQMELAGLTRSIAADLSNSDNPNFATSANNQVNSRVRNYLTAAAAARAQNWLSQFGRAEVSLNEGTDGLQWGLDYLQPLYDDSRQNWLLATGSHTIDERTLFDVGVVYRHMLSTSSLMGINLFADNEPETGHTRASVGLEARTRHLRLDSNFYEPLSDWQSSDVHLDGLAIPSAGTSGPWLRCWRRRVLSGAAGG